MERQAFEEAYNLLNSQQKQAVETLDGVISIIAGPGSGKTQLLGVRIANILDATDANPENILCLTFTDSAAANMRERVAKFVGTDNAARVRIQTFHSFGRDVVAENTDVFGYISDFRPVDELDQRIILQTIIDNLPYDSKLRSYHPELGYSFLIPLKNRISEFKKAGLNPEQAEQLLEESIIFAQDQGSKICKILENINAKNALELCEEVIQFLTSHKQVYLKNYESLHAFCLRTCVQAAEEIRQLEGRSRTKPLTAWKKLVIHKNNFLVAEQERILKELCFVYNEYAKVMHKNGWIDFDDMLLLVAQELKNNTDLCARYQEQFQYILVDEFQDSNKVQNQIIYTLGNHPVHEGNPNILVVGDDDQAIYKFGGAHSGVLVEFLAQYPRAITIHLSTNYRSTPGVVHLANTLASHILDRFAAEKSILPSEHLENAPHLLTNTPFESVQQQYASVAESIQTLLTKGVEPKEIAILARSHNSLNAIIPYLNSLAIRFSYHRAESPFNNADIDFVFQVLRYSTSVFEYKHSPADELLPQILLHPSFNIPRADIWKLSTLSDKTPWIIQLKNSSNITLQNTGLFLEHLATIVHSVTFQEWISVLIGTTEVRFENGVVFTSALKSSLCNTDALISGGNNAARYSKFLRQLANIINKLEEYRGGGFLSAAEAFKIIENAQFLKIDFALNEPENIHAVQLFTAHRSKGLEFEYVFLIDADQETWFPTRKPPSKLPWPPHLPFAPEGDTHNDIIRILYVALTRAKHTFHATYAKQDAKSKPQYSLSYFSHLPLGINPVTTNTEMLEKTVLGPVASPYDTIEREILQQRASKVVLSASTFLSYIDLMNAGPTAFIERTLLKFPQAIPTQVRYGNVIHSLLEYTLRIKRSTGTVPPLEKILELIPAEIQRHGIRKEEQSDMQQKASETLARCYALIVPEWNSDDEAEVNFASHGVHIHSIPITGKVDRLTIKDTMVHVFDYKTGKQLSSKSGAERKMQELRYKYQFYFYKSLIENSRQVSALPLHVEKGEFLFVDNQAIERFVVRPDDLEERDFFNLLKLVYNQILNLQFPSNDELARYANTNNKVSAEGALQFIEDLLKQANQSASS